MSDRLAELRRQRALIQEHLEWLDREIGAHSTSAGSPAQPESPPPAVCAPVPLTAPRPAPSPATPPPALSDRELDALLDPYRTTTASVQKDVRKGCLLYFVIGMLLLALGVVALAFLLRSP